MAVEPHPQSSPEGSAAGTGAEGPSSAVPALAQEVGAPVPVMVPLAPVTPEPAQAAPAPRPPEQPGRHHVAPAVIALDRVDDDDQLRIRSPGNIERLAQNLARLGQLFPVDLRLKPPDRFQVICGFRRVAALRFLQRDQVVARLHTGLSDEEALLMALSAAIDQEPVSKEELAEARARLEMDGRLTPAARDMLDKATFGDELAPESVEEVEAAQEEEEEGGEGEEEVDADELAGNVAVRLAELNQDLALLADVFGSLEPERRRELLQQLSYAADLVAYLESR